MKAMFALKEILFKCYFGKLWTDFGGREICKEKYIGLTNPISVMFGEDVILLSNPFICPFVADLEKSNL